ncbi:MAG TPA: protease pro-enzyme activation domain-containing protein, partial [Candidatus Acidoferrales bacterium]
MTSPSFTVKTLLCAVLAALALPLIASAQTSQTIAVPSRVTQAINEADIVTLRGNTHPLAQARFDQGAAADSMPMQRMLLVLKRSANQEAALDSLLEQQQDPTSANYHHWLTPQQFGQQFGPSDQDIQTVMNWLQAHGFTVAGASNGRTVIEFSGTAGQVRQAFHTEIHRYALNGQSHWANSSDPQIPDALSPVVAGVNTLYNFPRQSMHEIVGAFNRSRATGVVTPALGSNLTFPNPCNPTSQPVCNFAVGPADFAEIYNVPNAALVPAPATAYNGNNQTIVIVGESDVNTNDVTAFRTLFGLPAANLTTIVSGPDPGFDPGGAETEADLDIEWAGAVAPNAAIDYVIAQPTEASLGVDLAAQYAVDNNLGSVLSESYGICEFFMGTADNVFYNNLWQQAAAQGITVTASSGDGGSTVCDQNAGTQGAAQYGLSVSGVASTPFNVAVGGTDFNDLNLFTQFWNVIPADTPTVPSALGYIPEMTWNDTCTNQELFALFDATTAEQSCNNSTEKNDGLVGVEGGSGGQSNCTVSDSQNLSTCSGGYAKPSWQTSNGVPADGKRDIPDVSLFASNGFNGSFYIVCEEDLLPQYEQTGTASCDPYATATSFIGVGGTSASTPAFAGIMALVDQATSSRQGNANYILYKLAAQSGGTCASAANPPTNCIFHDVPSGSTIQMPCVSSSPNCTTTLSGDSTGVLTGFASTSGYDLATGLGSVNASNLIRNWISFAASLKPSTTSLTLNGGTTAISITHGQFVSVSVNVAPTQGTGTPTGAVSLVANTGASGTQSVANSALAPGSESATFSTNALPGGASYTVDADYPGDGTFAPSTSNPVTVTVSPESSDTKLSVITYSPTTGQIINANASSVQYGSSYLLRTDVTNPSGSDCVTESTGLQSYACPTGTVSVFSDGIPLLASGLSLNSQAYAESQPIQITGGAHSLTADYSGDSSYTAGSTVLPLTVTPAPTTTTLTTPISSQTVVIGSSISVGGQAISNSFGSYPTGTFTALDGTQPLTGTVTTFGYPAKSTGEVFLNGSIATSLSGPSGPHVVTLKYSGDANYSSSVSSAVTVNAVYPTTMSLAANPNNFVYGANTPVILTATLSTNNPASNAALKPTGTISFRASIDQISGSVSTTVGPDQNGNWSIQTTVTVTPQQSEYFYATYAGDQNYAGSSNLGGTFVSVL